MITQVCLINGSPRGENSCSGLLINEVCHLLEKEGISSEVVPIVKCGQSHSTDETMAMILQSACLIFAFPLYIDAIPSNMLEFMEQLDEYHRHQPSRSESQILNPRVYAIVNNGFIEGIQNKNALNMMRHFTNGLGFNWRFGIGIGGGEFLRETQNTLSIQSKLKQPVYQCLCKLAQDIKNEEIACANNLFVNPKMPKSLFIIAGNHGWISQAKQNHLKKKDLFARP